MPSINRIRLVNFGYDNGNKFIEDETFNAGGEDILFKLANGGGKSTLIHLISQSVIPNAKMGERRLKGYFKGTNQTTHILVEWRLDSDKPKYLLVGICITKQQQNEDDEKNEGIKWISYTHQYEHLNPYDLASFPVVSSDRYAINMEQLKRILKEGRTTHSISRTFDKIQDHTAHLQTFNILDDEWSTILKINKAEGNEGIVAYFKDQRKPEDLIKNTFLTAIDKVLATGNPHSTSLQALFDQHIQSLIKLPEIEAELEQIDALSEAGQNLVSKVKDYDDAKSQLLERGMRVNGLRNTLRNQWINLDAEITYRMSEIEKLNKQKNELEWQKESYEVAVKKADAKIEQKMLNDIQNEILTIKGDINRDQDKLKLMEASVKYHEIDQHETDIHKSQTQIRIIQGETVVDIDSITDTSKKLLACCERDIARVEQSIIKNRKAIDQLSQERKTIKNLIEQLNRQIRKLENEKGSHSKTISDFDKRLHQVKAELDISSLMVDIEKELRARERSSKEQKKRIDNIQKEKTSLELEFNALCESRNRLQQELEHNKGTFTSIKLERDRYFQDRDNVLALLMPDGLDSNDIYSGNAVLFLKTKLQDVSNLRASLNEKIYHLKKQELLLARIPYYISQEDILNVVDALRQREYLDAIAGSEYLASLGNENTIRAMIHQHPVLPYSVLVTSKTFEQIARRGISSEITNLVPIVIREDIEASTFTLNNQFIGGIHGTGYLRPNDEEYYVSPQKVQSLKQGILQKINELEQQIHNAEQAEDSYKRDVSSIIQFQERYPSDWLAEQEQQLLLAEGLLQKSREQLASLDDEEHKLNVRRSNLGKDHLTLLEESQTLTNEVSILLQLLQQERDANQARERLNTIKNQVESFEFELESQLEQDLKNEQQEKSLGLRIQGETVEMNKIKAQKSECITFLCSLGQSAPEDSVIVGCDIETAQLYGEWAGLRDAYNKITADVEGHRRVISLCSERITKLIQEIIELGFSREQLIGCSVPSQFEINQGRKAVAEFEKVLKSKETEVVKIQARLEMLENEINKLSEPIIRRYQTIYDAFDALDDAVKKRIVDSLAELSDSINRTNGELAEKKARLEPILNLVEALDSFIARNHIAVSLNELLDVGTGNIAILADQIKSEYLESVTAFLDTQKNVQRTYDEMAEQFNSGNDTVKLFINNFGYAGDPAQKLFDYIHIRDAFATIEKVLQRKRQDIADLRERVVDEKMYVVSMCTRHMKDVIEQFSDISQLSSISIGGERRYMLKIKLGEYEKEVMTEGFIAKKIELYVDSTIQKMREDWMACNGDIAVIYQKSRDLYSTWALLNQLVNVKSTRIQTLKMREHSAPEYVAWESVYESTSGGELYVSCFVVFITLLAYIRGANGDTETRKVLLADNPFGAVTSPHLLQVIFALAKKTNTQVIAFTGINDDRIYRYFNRIYSLKLVPTIAGRGSKLLAHADKQGASTEPEMPDTAQWIGALSLFDDN